MKTKLSWLLALAGATVLQAGPPTPNKPMAPPPGVPIKVAPASPPDTTVEAVSVTSSVVITNAVLVTNVQLVTNLVVMTNTVLITNTVPKPEFVYDQKPLPNRPVLVTPEQAQAIIDRFRTNYPKLGSPRMLIYVNRELVDEQSGMKLTTRTERTENSRGELKGNFTADPKANPPGSNPQNNTVSVSAGGNVTVNAGAGDLRPGNSQLKYNTEKQVNENSYRFGDRQALTLADRQTIRDVERLFGRPLRLGGVSLADQRIATQLIGDKPIKAFTSATEGEAARKDREALAKITDVVLEVLITSRQITVPEVSGDKLYSVPDIQATAIRLADTKIIGQATAADLIGKDRNAGRIVRYFDVRDIAEATALSLMEDIMISVH